MNMLSWKTRQLGGRGQGRGIGVGGMKGRGVSHPSVPYSSINFFGARYESECRRDRLLPTLVLARLPELG
jgi:hypothetical protein